jgi:hypothetical protein
MDLFLNGDANPVDWGEVCETPEDCTDVSTELGTAHRFWGVIDTDGITEFEFLETEGTLEDQKFMFADDFTFAAAGVLGDVDCAGGFAGTDVLIQASLVLDLIECTQLPSSCISSCGDVLARSDWDCDGGIDGTDVLVGASIIVNIIAEGDTPRGQGCI